jgi:hypothetical protein
MIISKLKLLKKTTTPSLGLCILFDLIGWASYSIPFLGEFADLLWAPLSGLLFYRMFGGRLGLFGGLLNTAEELLPFTDFIPSFSIAWVIRFLVNRNTSIPGTLPVKA